MNTKTILNILALFSAHQVVALPSAKQQERPSLRGTRKLPQFSCSGRCVGPDTTIEFIEECFRQCDEEERTSAPTPAPTPIPSFRIINPRSGRALDIRGNDCHHKNDDNPGSSSAASRMEIRNIDDNRPTQRFYFGPDDSILSVGCNHAITAAANDCSAAGSAVHLAPFTTGGPHQQWAIEQNDDKNQGVGRIVSTGENCNLVLDVFGKQTFDGADIILYHPNGQGNQDWVIVV